MFKTLELLNIWADQKGSYNLNVETRVDFASTGTSESIDLSGTSSLFGTALYGTDRYGGENLIKGRLEIGQEGEFFQFKFFNSNIDEPIEVKGFQPWLSTSDNL